MTTYNIHQVTVGTLDANGKPVSPKLVRAGSNATTTALDAAMATLVADGASPTQAHVTAANAALTAFETANTSASVTGDVILAFSPNVTKKNTLREAVAQLMSAIIDGSNLLT